MMTYRVKVTWVLSGTNNAACIGNDETEVSIESESPSAACRVAAENHLNHYYYDWDTGRYDVIAEHLDGSEVYTIQFESPAGV